MELVTVYKTADGRTFENKDAATEHEALLQATQELTQLLETTIKTGRFESVIKHLIVESAEVSTILTKYRKRLPRKKIAA